MAFSVEGLTALGTVDGSTAFMGLSGAISVVICCPIGSHIGSVVGSLLLLVGSVVGSVVGSLLLLVGSVVGSVAGRLLRPFCANTSSCSFMGFSKKWDIKFRQRNTLSS